MSSSMEKTYAHFLNVIFPSTIKHKKLLIPNTFVGRYGDELSSVATITNPNGYVSRVGVTKDEKKIWFQDGWNEFMEYHSICVGYFVVFQYRENSNFQAFIYDTTTYEIQYPLRNMCSPPSKNGCELQGKTCKMEELKVKDEADNVNDSMQNITEAPCPTIGGNELIALLEDMKIYIQTRRSLSLEERLRAINAARLFKPKCPSFLVFLRASNVQQHSVYVPVTFSRKFLNEDKSVIVQDSYGRKFAAKMKLKYRNLIFKGYCEFFEENNFKEGDILLFEMVKLKTNDILLKVSVFHA